MRQTTSTLRASWGRVLGSEVAAEVAPGRPGIYAYAQVARLHGLPVRLDWVYVGQAAKLNQRFRQHSLNQERNPRLLQWLETPSDREVWYLVAPEEGLDRLERDLIVALQPRLNRILYRSHQLGVPFDHQARLPTTNHESLDDTSSPASPNLTLRSAS